MSFPYSHILSVDESEGTKGQLFLSGVGMLAKGELLSALGIRAVLTVMDPWACSHYKVLEKAQHLQLQHLWLKVEDDQEFSLLPHLPPAISFIIEHLPKHNVLVHCQAGVSRSASVVIAFLMQTRGMSYSQAKAFVKSKRTCIQPNKGFEKELMNMSQNNDC